MVTEIPIEPDEQEPLAEPEPSPEASSLPLAQSAEIAPLVRAQGAQAEPAQPEPKRKPGRPKKEPKPSPLEVSLPPGPVSPPGS